MRFEHFRAPLNASVIVLWHRNLKLEPALVDVPRIVKRLHLSPRQVYCPRKLTRPFAPLAKHPAVSAKLQGHSLASASVNEERLSSLVKERRIGHCRIRVQSPSHELEDKVLAAAVRARPKDLAPDANMPHVAGTAEVGIGGVQYGMIGRVKPNFSFVGSYRGHAVTWRGSVEPPFRRQEVARFGCEQAWYATCTRVQRWGCCQPPFGSSSIFRRFWGTGQASWGAKEPERLRAREY